MKDRDSTKDTGGRSILLKLALSAATALISIHIFYVLAAEFSRAGTLLWVDIPLWHHGTRLIPQNGVYDRLDLAITHSAPLAVIIVLTVASRAASTRLTRYKSSAAIWTQWMFVAGMAHLTGNLIAGLNPHTESGYVLSGIAFMLGGNNYIAPFFALLGVMISAAFLRQIRKGFYKLSPSRSLIMNSPTRFLVVTTLLPWIIVTAVFGIVIPAAIIPTHRLVVWIFLGLYLTAAILYKKDNDEPTSIVRGRRMSGIGAVVAAGLFVAGFYAMGRIDE